MDKNYWELINQITDEIGASGLSLVEWFDGNKKVRLTPSIRKAMALREQKITKQEENDYRGLFVSTGVYKIEDLSIDQRFSLFLVGKDAMEQSEPRNYKRFCQPYESDSPLFKAVPGLYQLVRKDLLSVKTGAVKGSGQIIQYPSFLCRIDALHNKHFSLYESLFNFRPRGDLYLRVNQFDTSQSDIILCLEEVIRPMDPKFIQGLKIYRGEKKWGCYELIKHENASQRQIWDYYQGYGKLEVVFKRYKNTLSCMIEELPREMSGRVLTGLCIHATCDCPVGTNWNEAVADHIDGAVNYYFDETALERLESNISTAECKASCRTHLFRVEDIKLSNLLPISNLFFNAESLVQDWIKDQFSLVKINKTIS